MVYIIYKPIRGVCKMLFSKNTDPRCQVCVHAQKINEKDAICSRNGIVSLGYKCRHFKYDAIKRVPAEDSANVGDFSAKDFSID